MIKRSFILLLIVYLLLPVVASRAQNEDILSRDGDESATTEEERLHVLDILRTAAQQARDAGDLLKAARFLNRVGRLQIETSSFDDAIKTFEEALKILAQTPAPTIQVACLNGKGSAYNNKGQRDQAQTILLQSIAISEQNGVITGKAEALLTLSNCQNHRDHGLALKTAQEALALWQSVNNKRGIANSYAAMGHYQYAQNDLAAATQSQEAALELWRELNVTSEQAEVLINLGYIEFRKGAWQKVFEFFTQAQEMLDEVDEPYKMGQINAGFAEAFIESGLPEIGLSKYRQALENYTRAKNRPAKIAMVFGIGRAYYLLGNDTEAQMNLQRSLTDAEEIGDIKVAALCNDFLGQTYKATNDQAAALRYFEVALQLYTQTGCPMEAARVRALIGQVNQQQGKFEQARASYQESLKVFRALSDQVNQSATLYALGNLEFEQNHLDLADDYLRQSIEMTEAMRRVSTSRDLTAAFSATSYGRYEKYIDCLMRKHQAHPEQNLVVQAFKISEVSRARSLAELLRSTQINMATGLDPELAAREKVLRQLLRVKEDDKVTLLSRAYEKQELVATEEELARLESEYKQVSETIRTRYPAYAQITSPTVWDLSQIQTQVIADDQTVLLEYSLGSDKSYVWAVTRDNIKNYNLTNGTLINQAAQKVHTLLSAAPDSNTANQLSLALQELSQMILSPIAEELNKPRIIIVADGALHYIPFQVLPAPSVDKEPLVANYEIVNVPSASILGELRKKATQRQPTKLLAAFGNPKFAAKDAQPKDTAGGQQTAAVQVAEIAPLQHVLRDVEMNRDSFDPSVIQRLLYAGQELANLRDATSGSETFIASGEAATRQQLLGMDLSQYAILHFATHGLLDPKRPEYSGLLLSTVDSDGHTQDGFVGLQDIYGLRVPVDLVVLSACQTALGKDVRGEGLLGLTRGFMYAGASSVMASLWKVDDEATAELMKQTYRNMLKEGKTPAAALRAAQNSIRQRPEWQSPYYWGGFTLQGEYRQVIKPISVKSVAGLYWKLIISGALVLLAGVAVWFGRRRMRTPIESR